jgi:hypothetical protein
MGGKGSLGWPAASGPYQLGNGLVSGRSATVVAMNSSAISVACLLRAYRDLDVVVRRSPATHGLREDA